jgi:hypothetical protein
MYDLMCAMEHSTPFSAIYPMNKNINTATHDASGSMTVNLLGPPYMLMPAHHQPMITIIYSVLVYM